MGHPTSVQSSPIPSDGQIDAPSPGRSPNGSSFLFEAKDLNEAIAIAGRIPGAPKGTVEVRPVVELPCLPMVR